MKSLQQQLEEFFAAYEQRFNDALSGVPTDVEAAAGAFADYFVGSNPLGVQGAKNDEEFRKAIPRGNEFYKSIGTLTMKIDRLNITQLDDLHVVVKVHWQSFYKNNVNINFNVFYMLTLASGGPKIFAYITGDEQKVLQENGLVPKQ